MTIMILVITEQQMRDALKANGWVEYWSSEYFTLKDSQGQGIPLKDAFAVLLDKSNILSVEDTLDGIRMT